MKNTNAQIMQAVEAAKAEFLIDGMLPGSINGVQFRHSYCPLSCGHKGHGFGYSVDGGATWRAVKFDPKTTGAFLSGVRRRHAAVQQ